MRSAASEDYNGKLEAPRVLAAALDPAAAFRAAGEAPGSGEAVVAAWDFSHEMSSTRIIDTGPTRYTARPSTCRRAP